MYAHTNKEILSGLGKRMTSINYCIPDLVTSTKSNLGIKRSTTVKFHAGTPYPFQAAILIVQHSECGHTICYQDHLETTHLKDKL